MRYLQQKFVPTFSPDTKILGVVIPTVEEALLDDAQRVGVLATNTTVHAHIYEAELHKIKPSLEVFEIAAPKLVPLIEQNNIKEAELAATQYASQFENIDSLILGCTHYPLLKNALRKFMPEHVHIVSQDELMGQKLQDYLKRHMEIDICLSREGTLKIFVSKINDDYRKVAATLFPKAIVEEVLHA